ncbi:MAG: hypothetical protein AAF902_01875 [Chloroflexota bacterium]
MLDTLLLDNQIIKLMPLADVADHTGIDVAKFEELIIAPVPGGDIWADKPRMDQIVTRLISSLPRMSSVDALPNLPDQLAVLLRGEITQLSGSYPVTLDEKDWIEQHLQNVLRPVVYKFIERQLTGNQARSWPQIVDQVLSESAGLGWQTAEIDGWQIQIIDTVLGGTALKLSAENETIYSQIPIYPELEFFFQLLNEFTATLDKIVL